MALRWLEGWETCTTEEIHLARIYEVLSGTVGLAIDGANEDAGEAISSGLLEVTTYPLVGSVQNSWIIGLAFRANDAVQINNTAIPYVAIANGDGEQVRFEFVDADPTSSKPGGNYYKIRVMRGATELASCDQRFHVSVEVEDWIYFEFKVTIDNSSGSFAGRWQYARKPASNVGAPFTLTWDAASSSVDTQEQTSTGGDRFTLSMNSGSASDAVATDDIYVADSTGSKNNDYIGKIIIEAQKPSGDGNTTDWQLADAASTQVAWDETTTAVDDDARVMSDTTSQVHLATVDALVAMTGANTTIVGIRNDIIAHMETSGDLDIAHIWRKTTGTPAETNSGSVNVDSTTYRGSSVVLEDDPNTATDWDIADLNSYQYGVRNDG